MKTIDQYHKWVEWSEEDQVYIGKCPDLITGIHGDDPVKVFQDLCEVLDDVESGIGVASGRARASGQLQDYCFVGGDPS